MTDIAIERALVLGATGGIGAAVIRALQGQAAEVLGLARADGFDLTDEAAVDRVLGAIEPAFDLIVIATGGLSIADAGGRDDFGPEKSLRQIASPAMAAQFALNAIGPALVLRHVPRLLRRDGPGRVLALSARVGSIGDNRSGGWYSYRAAKAALNQIVHSAAIELRRSHPASICVAYHPGTVQTNLTRRYLGRHPAVTPEVAAQNLLSVALSLGPEDTGQFFDWQGKAVPW
jgi:NAD(P)-dependent dehydrogenase (short-subunit alcohol dehydrogenase family)